MNDKLSRRHDNGEPSLNVELVRRCDHWSGLEIDESALVGVARSAYAIAGGKVAAEAVIVLSGDEEIRALNKRWANNNKATNVLSFAASNDGPELGDIVLAFETISREAAETGKTVPHHVSHLIVHGLLHLMGYDHKSDEDAAMMEELEIRILGEMGIANPYAGNATEPALDQ